MNFTTKKRANMELRNEIAKRHIKHWQVAQALEIRPEYFSKIMRYELSDENKELVMDAIRSVKP